MKYSLFIFLFLILVGFVTNRRDLGDLKNELAQAQKKLEQQKIHIASLEEEIARLEIEKIQKELNQISKQEAKKSLAHDQWLALFSHQRDILDKIIRSTPTYRSEAQAVLDQILTLITQLSD
jgi:predicted RNase H-like nuclease (RuvC/YqgF family)